MVLMKVFICALLVNMVYSFTLIKNIEHILERERRSDECAVPNNIDELFTNLNSHVNRVEFLIAVNATHQPNAQGFIPPAFGDQTDTECPKEYTGKDTSNSEIWQRSTCPWFYSERNYGAEYYPSKVFNAACKCVDCLYSKNNFETGCSRIYKNINILKKTGCSNGFYTYEQRSISVSVGCTCAKLQANIG
ncbi:hypothetical protein LOTGIDRAFT_176347 [Lottia gigantea]|nr:hypothetical protein LOTGIDRAFT_176347 [Lottia gigantea]ESP04379.1 hypothetical protein LOTGIDRAFT_176347 [Lottia gigantea]